MSRRSRFTRNLGRRVVAPLPARALVGYVRFEHAEHDDACGPFTHARTGLARLTGDDRVALRALLDWFDEHLEAPVRMVPFRYVGERRARRQRRDRFVAHCWFRDDATEHVSRARALVALLERAGIPFVERRTHRMPGALCAEDAFQIAVVPYRDARRC